MKCVEFVNFFRQCFNERASFEMKFFFLIYHMKWCIACNINIKEMYDTQKGHNSRMFDQISTFTVYPIILVW